MEQLEFEFMKKKNEISRVDLILTGVLVIVAILVIAFPWGGQSGNF